jgi:hypothetical protein
MTNTRHSSKAPHGAGLFALLRAVFRFWGSGARSRARQLTVAAPVALVLALAGVLALGAAAASARPPRESRNQIFASSVFSQPGVFGADGEADGVAVNQETGKVYVGEQPDENVSPGGVVEIFTAEGERPPVAPTQIAAGYGFVGVAVDNSGDPADPSNGDVYITEKDHDVVAKYKLNALGSAYELVGDLTLNREEPTDVAVDTEGNVYIATRSEIGRKGEIPAIAEFTSAGVKIGQIDQKLIGYPQFVAVGAPGVVYVGQGHPGSTITGVAKVTVSATDEVEHEAMLDPSGHAVAVDPVSGNVYADNGGSISGYDAAGQLFEEFGAGDLHSGSIGVAVNDTTEDVYVSNTAEHFGDDEADVVAFGASFPLPPYPEAITAPASEFQTTEGLASAAEASVTLGGEVNPEVVPVTECFFEYGQTEAYGHRAECEAPDAGEIPVDDSLHAVHAVVKGLALDSVYHFRFVAVNANGREAGEDRSFISAGPGLDGESSSKVAATSATLDAAIDPNNGLSSGVPGARESYYFQYGTSSGYGSLTPAVPASLGQAETDLVASRHIQGLSSGTVYHYRTVVLSEPKSGEVRIFYGPDQTFTTQPPGASLLLADGRQWELVSPAQKHGAFIFPIEEAGALIQSSADGGALTFAASVPTEAAPPGYTNREQLLATRTATGWRSRDIDTPHSSPTGFNIGNGWEYRIFSADLSRAIVAPWGAFAALAGEETSPTGSERTPYSRANLTCQATPATCYTPLVTHPGDDTTEPFVPFGGDEQVASLLGAVAAVGATPDLSHVILESTVPLTSAPAGCVHSVAISVVISCLYEWSAGQLRLVSVLPGEQVGVGGKLGAPGGTFDVRNAISDDGSRVVWSAETETLYMRDTARGETVQIGGGEAKFAGASSDDSKVFFTQGGKYHEDLYVFEVTSDEGEPLAGKLTRLSEGAEVQGTVLGASEDGAYVYFVANGVLGDAGARGAAPGDCGYGEESETCNLYVEHYSGSAWEVPAFIATLSGADFPDWNNGLAKHTSRVSPDGRYLAFMSQRSLTGYDNTDVSEAETPVNEFSQALTRVHHDEEVFLYHAAEHPGTESGGLVCASCNPTGARPVGVNRPVGAERFFENARIWRTPTWFAANVPGFTPFEAGEASYQSRYLSDSGRLFFNSHEALVPQDVNGTWDVYEYEPPGIGTCEAGISTFSARSGGCVGLVSSGESSEESAFLDASEGGGEGEHGGGGQGSNQAGGGDVFFLSAAKLTPTNVEGLNIYDAHECTSDSPCPPPPAETPPPCTTEASCRPAPASAPAIFGAAPSETFNGAGNLAPPAPAASVLARSNPKPKACKQGSTKNKHNKCVRKKSRKQSKSAKKASDDRRARR